MVMNRKSVKLNDVDCFIPCPRSTFFLIHDPITDLYTLKLCESDAQWVPSPNDAIVYAAVLSEFTPYFIYLEDDNCAQALEAVGNLVVESIRLSTSWGRTERPAVPAQLKRLYFRTLHFLKKLQGGTFLTDIFMRKLWRLPYRIWKYIQAYRKWLPTHSNSYSLVTEQVC